MKNDIMIVIGFIIIVIAMCKIWNIYAMHQYKKSKEKRLGLTYCIDVNSTKKIQIVGVGNDENGDYDVATAISKTELPDNIRIKLKWIKLIFWTSTMV